MIRPDDIAATIAGHPDTARVSVPVSFLREIERDYRRNGAILAQASANVAIGEICAELAR